MGHRNFTAWIKYFKFETKNVSSLCFISPSTAAEVVFYWFPHTFLSGWMWVQLCDTFAVKHMKLPWSTEEKISAYHFPHIQILQCSRNTLNITSIVKRMLLILSVNIVLYVKKIFKNYNLNKSNRNIYINNLEIKIIYFYKWQRVERGHKKQVW